MKLTPIADSSMLAAHGHDPETGKLRVQFKNGATYEYDGIPLEKYAAFTGAASPGSFFNKRIKDAYPGRKVKD